MVDWGWRSDDAVRYLFDGSFLLSILVDFSFASLYTHVAGFPEILGKLRNEKAA